MHFAVQSKRTAGAMQVVFSKRVLPGAASRLAAIGVRNIPKLEAIPKLSPAVFFFFGGLLPGAFRRPLQHRIVRHAGAAAAPQRQYAFEEYGATESDDDDCLEHG